MHLIGTFSSFAREIQWDLVSASAFVLSRQNVRNEMFVKSDGTYQLRLISLLRGVGAQPSSIWDAIQIRLGFMLEWNEAHRFENVLVHALVP